jgi:hypothetical protein
VHSVEVVAMASETLKKLLATSTGFHFSQDYKEKLDKKDFLFEYLHPFRAHKGIKVRGVMFIYMACAYYHRTDMTHFR